MNQEELKKVVKNLKQVENYLADLSNRVKAAGEGPLSIDIEYAELDVRKQRLELERLTRS